MGQVVLRHHHPWIHLSYCVMMVRSYCVMVALMISHLRPVEYFCHWSLLCLVFFPSVSGIKELPCLLLSSLVALFSFQGQGEEVARVVVEGVGEASYKGG